MTVDNRPETRLERQYGILQAMYRIRDSQPKRAVHPVGKNAEARRVNLREIIANLLKTTAFVAILGFGLLMLRLNYQINPEGTIMDNMLCVGVAVLGIPILGLSAVEAARRRP